MKPPHVLVVDDDLVLNFTICETLKDSGMHAVGVHSVAAALEVMEQGAELSALVTDIDLGPGPDGFDIAHRARITNPQLHVVFISGTATARRRAQEIKRSEFLGKPFGPPEIVEALHRLVAANQAPCEV